MDWLAISGLIGMILPVLIELCSKKISGKWKIIIVWTVCFIVAIVQTGVDGGLSNWNWNQFGVSFVVILGLSIEMWKGMWKQWFPKDPDPYLILESEPIKFDSVT